MMHRDASKRPRLDSVIATAIINRERYDNAKSVA
jgi:hypothetical protein